MKNNKSLDDRTMAEITRDTLAEAAEKGGEDLAVKLAIMQIPVLIAEFLDYLYGASVNMDQILRNLTRNDDVH